MYVRKFVYAFMNVRKWLMPSCLSEKWLMPSCLSENWFMPSWMSESYLCLQVCQIMVYAFTFVRKLVNAFMYWLVPGTDFEHDFTIKLK